MEQFMWILITGIPSLLVGVVLAKMARNESKAAEKEADQDERGMLILKGLNANFTITKELTECVLHNKLPNGELEDALRYKQDVKHEIEDYMRRKAAK